MVVHPLIVFTTGTVVVVVTSGYTRRGSLLRYVALLLLIGIAFVLPQTFVDYADSGGWMGRTLAGAGLWNVITLFDRLILRGWDFESYKQRMAQVEASKSNRREERPSPVPKTNVEFGLEVSGNARGTNTFWEVRNIPHFKKDEPDYVPSQTSFIVWHVTTAVAAYYAHNWVIAKMLDIEPRMLDERYVPMLSRSSDVTTHELAVRSLATFSYWTAQSSNMQFFYSLAAIATAIGTPQDIPLFRPLFGRSTDAYTMRNSWGKTWHQSLRSGLEGTSAFLAHDALRLPKTGLLQRYGKIFFSFAISGLMHIFADHGGGVHMLESGALHFFCVQTVGIIIEDAVQAMWSNTPVASTTTGKILARLLGYVWVAVFVVWSSPVWIYPVILKMRKEDAMLGFGGPKAILFGRLSA